jgi:membrane fusion protein (multidrug efflux system)
MKSAMKKMMRKRKKFYSLIFVGLLAVITVGVGVDRAFFHDAPEDFSFPVTAVKIGHVESKQIPLQISALGQVRSLEEIDLVAEQAGYLTEVNVKNGAMVQKGQVLFQIDNKNALAGVLSAKAALDQAQSHFDRIQILVKEGAESQDVLESDQKNLDQAQAALDEANKMLSETIVKAPFAGQVTYTDLAVGSYVNIGDKLIGIVNSQSFFIQYVLPASYLNLTQMGQTVTFNNPLNNNPLNNNPLNNNPLNRKEKINAKVIYVSPEVDPQSQSFVVRALIENPPENLKSGLSFMVTQILNPTRQVLALPGLALLGDPNGFYVFLVKKSDEKNTEQNTEQNTEKNNQFQVLTRRVVVGEQFDSWIEIKSGLTTLDSVVIEGQQKIHEGQWVRPINAVETIGSGS